MALLSSCRDPGPQLRIHTTAGDVAVSVELALTEEQRRRGLMWRDSLGDSEGMLFVFPDEGPLSFWMKNTPSPLDIVFINSDKRVVSVAANTVPYSEKRIPSRGPSRFVLEVKAGFCKRHGVRAGDRISLPPDLVF
ncbi:MAG: DUF192 domain-containing protein [Candidatus Binatia bacterium]